MNATLFEMMTSRSLLGLRRALLLGAATLFVGGSTTPVAAYNWYEAEDSPVTCDVDADQCIPMRWFRTELTYRFSTVVPEEVDGVAMVGVLADAFGQWDVAGCKVPQIDYAGTTAATQRTTPTSLLDAPDNIITFVTSKSDWQALNNSPTWLAITLIAHNTATGEIIDADMEINDGHHVFSIADAPPNGSIDLVSTLTHEAGHFLGLDHSVDEASTMYSTYTGGDPTQARSLAEDDQNGVCGLYETVPAPKPTPPPEDDGCSGGEQGRGLGAMLLGLFVGLVVRRRRFGFDQQ